MREGGRKRGDVLFICCSLSCRGPATSPHQAIEQTSGENAFLTYGVHVYRINALVCQMEDLWHEMFPEQYSQNNVVCTCRLFKIKFALRIFHLTDY